MTLIDALHGSTMLVLGALAWCDWRSRHLPNALLAMLLVLALCMAGANGVALNWGAAAMAMVVGFLLSESGIWGAGDAKLMSLCILMIADAMTSLLFDTAMLGGILAVWCGLRRRYFISDDKTLLDGVPYGVAIAFSTALNFPGWHASHVFPA